MAKARSLVLSITLAGHLLLVFLGLTALLFALLSLRKENHFDSPLGGIFWFFLAVISLYSMVLLGQYLDKARALNRVSNRVEAMLSPGLESSHRELI